MSGTGGRRYSSEFRAEATWFRPLLAYHRGPTPPHHTPEEEGQKENRDQEPKEFTVRQNGAGSG